MKKSQLRQIIREEISNTLDEGKPWDGWEYARNKYEIETKFKPQNHSDHFVDWLGIWSKTINSLFEGEKAELAKEKARRMSTHLYVDIVKHKPKTTE